MAMKLQQVFDYLDRGVASDTSILTFERSKVQLNTNDFDGATYYWEIIASSQSPATPITVQLINNAGSVISSIVIPAALASQTRIRSASFSPTAGSNAYRIKTPATTLNQGIKIYHARIIIKQTNATKTRVFIPLLNADSDGYGGTIQYTDLTSSASYVQANADYYGIWTRDDSRYATMGAGNIWILEVTLWRSGGTSVQAALFNKTDNAMVTGTELTTTSTAPVLLTVSFASSAGNFHNLDNYEIRIKGSGGASCRISRASLSLALTSISKTETYLRFCRYVDTYGNIRAGQRILYEATDFDTHTCYHEGIGNDIADGRNPCMFDDNGNDSGNSGANYAASAINFGAGKSLIRSSALGLTDMDRFIGAATGADGHCKLTCSFLVVVLGAVTSNIKKVAGVSYAGIKKISGDPVATVKKVAGVA